MKFIFNKFSQEQKIALGEILGTIPSDGYFGLRNDKLYNYILCVKDRDFVEYVINDFSKLNIKVLLHKRKSGLWYVEVCRRCFDDLLIYLEKYSNSWIFSDKIMRSNNLEFFAAIIRSFTDADGTITCCIKDKKYYSRRIAIYNDSKKLLDQLQYMLKKFNITSYIRLDRQARTAIIKNQAVKFPKVYSLRITHYRNLSLFYNKINFKIKRKAKKLEETLNSYRHIGKEYSEEDYQKALSLYKQYTNCREVSRRTNIPPQTVQNWILLGKKPRILKII